MELKIDPEFEQKIPKLTEEEFAQLEENILSDGEIRDPLVIWNGTILDGHNRYRIYKKHPGLRFQTRDVKLSDRNEAIIWICKNQLGRRNLTLEQRRYVIGKRYEAEKAAHGGIREMAREQNGKFTASVQNEQLRQTETTAEMIAKETNTSDSYVRRAEHYAKGVDAADEVLPGIRDEILSGNIKPTEKAVSAVAKADPEERRELAEQLRQPRARPQEKEKTEAFTNTGKDENENIIKWLDDGDPEEEEMDFEEEDEEEEPEPRYIPTRKEILAISESMLHSEGVAAATEEDVMCEMKDALETLIWRWNNVGEVYAKVLRDKKTQKKIRELASEGMAFLREVRKGALWNEKG